MSTLAVMALTGAVAFALGCALRWLVDRDTRRELEGYRREEAEAPFVDCICSCWRCGPIEAHDCGRAACHVAPRVGAKE